MTSLCVLKHKQLSQNFLDLLMKAWVYSPPTDVFALGTSSKNCNWYPYLVFIERDLKLLGTQMILGETWDAKVHGWVNYKVFWRWRITLGSTDFQWMWLVLSNGSLLILSPEDGNMSSFRNVVFSKNSRRLKKSRNSIFPERLTICNLAKTEVDTTETEKNHICGPPVWYNFCKIWPCIIGIRALFGLSEFNISSLSNPKWWSEQGDERVMH
jgi:hypothetical protein